MNARLGALAIVLVAACHDSVGIEENLDSAQARWNQSSIKSYTFTFKLSCFCAPANEAIRVTVANDVPTAIVFADSTNVTADTTSLRNYLTIDRIFTTIHGKLQQNPAKFDAAYDAATGYPKTVTIDPSATAADDELGIQVTSLVPAPNP